MNISKVYIFIWRYSVCISVYFIVQVIELLFLLTNLSIYFTLQYLVTHWKLVYRDENDPNEGKYSKSLTTNHVLLTLPAQVTSIGNVSTKMILSNI